MKFCLVCSMYYHCSVLMIFHFLPVDSIGWIRDDSIVIGCVRLNEDDNEEGYLVQVIRSEENTFCEVNWSSRCLLFYHRIHITCYVFFKQKFHLQILRTCSYKVASIARDISLSIVWP